MHSSLPDRISVGSTRSNKYARRMQTANQRRWKYLTVKQMLGSMGLVVEHGRIQGHKVEGILNDIWAWAGSVLDRVQGAWRKKRDDAGVNLEYGVSAILYLRSKFGRVAPCASPRSIPSPNSAGVK
jgi:hypothetical protein